MSEIYSKTAKGQDEIKTRTGGLSQRTRQILIFVDGKRSGEELHAMLKGDDMDAQLHMLIQQGYITVSGTSPAQPKPAPAVVPSPAALKAMPVADEDTAAQREKWKKEEAEREELDVARHFMSKM
jgi:hypothetical protein